MSLSLHFLSLLDDLCTCSGLSRNLSSRLAINCSRNWSSNWSVLWHKTGGRWCCLWCSWNSSWSWHGHLPYNLKLLLSECWGGWHDIGGGRSGNWWFLNWCGGDGWGWCHDWCGGYRYSCGGSKDWCGDSNHLYRYRCQHCHRSRLLDSCCHSWWSKCGDLLWRGLIYHLWLGNRHWLWHLDHGLCTGELHWHRGLCS